MTPHVSEAIADRRPQLGLRSQLVLAGACLTVLFTAFEIKAAVFSIGPVSFTTSKIAAAIFIFASLAFAADKLSWYFSRRALDVAVILFIASNFLSVAAAADKPGAFKFAIRLVSAALVYLAVSRMPRRSRAHLWIAGSVAVTLGIETVIGMLENFVSAVQWPDVLEPFQEGVITFGTFYNVRISATLPFPTVFSVFLELTMPMALAFGVWYAERQRSRSARRWVAAATIVFIVCVMIVQVVSFTRTALVSTPLAFGAGAVLACIYGYSRRYWGYLVLAIAALLITVGFMTLFSNKMAARLDVAPQETHYGADYTLLSFPQQLHFGETAVARVHVRNTGSINWEPQGSDQVMLGYRWLTYPDHQDYDLGPDDNRLNIPSVPVSVPPGGETDIQIEFVSPKENGEYVLVFDLAKAHVGWFSSAGPPPLIIPLKFANGVSSPLTIPQTADSFKAGEPALVTPSRTQLWKAGLITWEHNPFLGVGPDQFRLRYNDYMPDLPHDDRVRTHNIFLEAMANTGIVGLAVMVFLLARMVWVQFRLVRNRSQGSGARYVSLALLIASFAYLVHGLDDFFLWQTGISFLFFIYLGLTSWLDYEAGFKD
ncbi:MAG: O-antigen ligase family protein [Actinobacteria bacterium]|nr:O-antigen ligase family protein [Actinomycetota bacterium]